MTNRIKKTFENLQLNDKKGIILYLTTGIPDNETTAELALELFNSGADIIELGIPFSDPLADGPTIQESSMQAIKNGINTSILFEQLKNLRKLNLALIQNTKINLINMNKLTTLKITLPLQMF